MLWRDGEATNLHVGGEHASTRAIDVNNHGDVLIRYSTAPCCGYDGQLWQDGTVHFLDDLRVIALNEGSQVVASGPSGEPLIWEDGVASVISGGTWDLNPTDINDGGWLIGAATTPTSGGWSRAFLKKGAAPPLELGTLGYLWSAATAVNNTGQIVGGSWVLPAADSKAAFLWTEEAGMANLGSLEGGPSMAEGINDVGQIVGWSGDRPSGLERAFLFENGRMFDLNDLIHTTSDWTLQSALDINEHGQIVGMGRVDGEQRGYLLTPISPAVPEPGSWLLAILAIPVCFASCRSRRVPRS